MAELELRRTHAISIEQAIRSTQTMWSAATRAVGDYHTADLRVGWRPSAQLEISVAGQNLLQPHHLEFRHEPGPPVGISRSASVRVTWTRPGR